MAANVELARVPYPVGASLQRWLEFVSRRGCTAYEWIVQGVRHYRGADTRWYFWKYIEQPKVSAAEARAAEARTVDAKKKREAGPSWSTIIEKFGEEGAERNAAGEVVGYKYPRPKDDEQRQKINAEVYEMWNPHRRISTDQGMERSANTEVTMLVDEKTGRERQVRATQVEKVAKKTGMREKRKRARKSGRKA